MRELVAFVARLHDPSPVVEYLRAALRGKGEKNGEKYVRSREASHCRVLVTTDVLPDFSRFGRDL